MCLSVPAKLTEVTGDMGKASIGGSIIEVGLQLIEDPKVGEYVLIHTGFALEKIDEEEALKTLELLRELGSNPELS